MTSESSPRRGLVIGCGGTLGAAWTVGALHAVREALDWDPRTADVLVGTSAGAEFVTLLGGGVGVDELLATQLAERPSGAPGALPPLPTGTIGSPALALRGLRRKVAPLTALTGLLPIGTGNPAWLDTMARHTIPEHTWIPHRAAWLVAVDYDTGNRIAFGSPGAPRATLSEALQASWAVPGWFPPITIEGRRYVDGGVASPTSADLLIPELLDEVIVLAPMASRHPGRPRGLGRIERLVRNAMSRTLDAELAALRATGTRVIRLDPGPADLAVMGPNFMDHRRRYRVLETSLRTSASAMQRQGVH